MAAFWELQEAQPFFLFPFLFALNCINTKLPPFTAVQPTYTLNSQHVGTPISLTGAISLRARCVAKEMDILCANALRLQSELLSEYTPAFAPFFGFAGYVDVPIIHHHRRGCCWHQLTLQPLFFFYVAALPPPLF